MSTLKSSWWISDRGSSTPTIRPAGPGLQPPGTAGNVHGRYRPRFPACGVAPARCGHTPQRIENLRIPAPYAEGLCYPVEVTANYFEYGGEGYILGLARDIRQRRREEERLRLLNECFVGFGTEAAANINRITVVVGRLMEASCALYNRLQSGMLCSIGQWQTPPGYPAEDRPEGHLCHDVIREPAAAPLVVRDLQRSPYAVATPMSAVTASRPTSAPRSSGRGRRSALSAWSTTTTWRRARRTCRF